MKLIAGTSTDIAVEGYGLNSLFWLSIERGKEIRMGLFDKPGQDAQLKELFDGRPFKLLGAEMRDVTTVYGAGTALDLTVEDLSSDEGKLVYSGFSAGILQMIRQADDDDFPVWVRVRVKNLGGNKTTTVLDPLSDDDISAIEAGRASDDDIPF